MAYSYEKIKNTLSYAVALNPDGAFPLDARVYFGALGDKDNPAEGTARYAAKNAKPAGSSESAYFYGQQIYVVENGEVTTYLIQTDGSLKEVGSATLGDDKTIVLDSETGTLSIKGYDDAAIGTKLVKTKDAEGNAVLAWSPDNQATLDEDLTELKSGVEAIGNRVTEVETAIAGLGDIINFAGVVPDIANISANDYEPGDILIEKKVSGEGENAKTLITEYICSKNDEDQNEWVSLGDPEGVVALQGRMDTAEGEIDELISSVQALSNLIGSLPEGEYSNIIDYINKQDAKTLADAKTYVNGEVEKLTKGQIAQNATDIAAHTESITNLNSSVTNLSTTKLDNSTFEDYKEEVQGKLDDKLDASVIENYTTTEDITKTYYTIESANELTSKVQGIENTVTDGTVGNANLDVRITNLKKTVDQNVEDIAANAEDIAANGLAITGLQTKVGALEEANGEKTSQINTLTQNIGLNKAAIEAIYKITTNDEGTTAEGYLANEINRAKLAESELDGKITAEKQRAELAEGSLDDRVTDLETANNNKGTLIEGLRTDVNNITESVIPTLETKEDANAKLEAAKTYTDEVGSNIDSRIDTLSSEIGNLANVMHFAGILANGGDYEITSVVAVGAVFDENGNLVTDEGLTVISNKSFDKGDVGIYEQKEYVCIAIDNAIEDSVFTSTWTAIGDVGATSALIEGLNTAVEGLQKNKVDTNTYDAKIKLLDEKDAELDSAIKAEETRATGIEEGLDSRLTIAEADIKTNASNIATNANNIATNATAIVDLGTELTSTINTLLSWGSF